MDHTPIMLVAQLSALPPPPPPPDVVGPAPMAEVLVKSPSTKSKKK
jgi:hypothetical protein